MYVAIQKLLCLPDLLTTYDLASRVFWLVTGVSERGQSGGHFPVNFPKKRGLTDCAHFFAQSNAMST